MRSTADANSNSYRDTGSPNSGTADCDTGSAHRNTGATNCDRYTYSAFTHADCDCCYGYSYANTNTFTNGNTTSAANFSISPDPCRDGRIDRDQLVRS